MIERQHERHCRYVFGLECTCKPIFVEVGHADTDGELRALVASRFARRDALKAEVERGFS